MFHQNVFLIRAFPQSFATEKWSMPNNLVSLKPTEKTSGDGLISHVTFLRSVFFLTVTTIFCN